MFCILCLTCYNEIMSLFFKKWFKNPFRMGSVVASSSSVGNNFAKQIDLSKPGYIVEVGAGTGTVTQALIDSGIPANRIICFEIESDFCDLLKEKFKGIQVENDDIVNLKKIVSIDQINCIVSTLPFLSLQKSKARQIMDLFADLVKDDIQYLQMAYSPFFHIQLRKSGLQAKKCAYVLKNFPPAYIYNCTVKI